MMLRKDLTPEQMKIVHSLENARARCTNPNRKDYKNYGGKGIQYRLEDNKSRIQVVLEQEQAWQECKRRFPNETVTINRIDHKGHYEEGNINWIPLSENMRQMHKDNPDKPWKKILIEVCSKPVKCLTSGETYPSAAEAERTLKIPSPNISECCHRKRKSAGKYKGQPRVWRFI